MNEDSDDNFATVGPSTDDSGPLTTGDEDDACVRRGHAFVPLGALWGYEGLHT